MWAPLLAALVACGDPSGPPVVDGDDLLFLRERADAPALQVDEVSFWATRGQDEEVRLLYTDGREALRFRVDDDALERFPDGRRFAEGDSVRITIRRVDPDGYNYEFQPAGLRFSQDEPAELRVSFTYLDPDVDGDGDVDDTDTREFDDASFWRQEAAGAPWERIGTARLDVTEEMRADLDGFTRYALASN